MHNYVDLNSAFNGTSSKEEFTDTIRGGKKMGEDDSNQQMEERVKKMKEERDADLRSLTGNKPPMSF